LGVEIERESRMRSDVLVILVLAGCGMVCVVQLARLLRARWLHQTIKKALSTQSPSVEQLIAKLDAPTNHNDGKLGALLLALAAALAGFGIVQGTADAMRAYGGGALFPAALGLVLVLSARRRGQGGGEP
jgi:Na+/alanine symporter